MTHTNAPHTDKVTQDIAIGRDVLHQGARGLERTAELLDASFTAALDVIMAQRGRVIVTGMGKPGHVSKKIAATLASTGTPAMFVHPGEASHGDMGMITENDVVLALSKSGESTELRDIVSYCKRFGIPLIGITQFPQSSLGRQADIVLTMPDQPEACPNQQAPTTSTTVMIAMGDALAVALMKRRGFTATDFRQFHPGGKLGGQLLAVRQLMITGADMPILSDTATVMDAQSVMSAKNFGCAILVDAHGLMTGFVSDGDLRRHLSADLTQLPVQKIIGTATPRTISDDALAAAALAVMNQHSITQLVVVDTEYKPIGLLRLHDLLRAGVA